MVADYFLYERIFTPEKTPLFKKFYLLKCHFFACVESSFHVRLEQLRERKL
jgi:hypothetical protein